MLYYSYELRWPSSDNTLKEPDASGSFYYRFWLAYLIEVANMGLPLVCKK